MVTDYTQISTKAGDKGQTSNFSGRCIQKTDALFEALGAIDELSSAIGVAGSQSSAKRTMQNIQADLQNIMSLIATDPKPDMDAQQFVATDPTYLGLAQIEQLHIQTLEALESNILASVSIGERFVLPGEEGRVSAYYDLARAICRRAERAVIRFADSEVRTDLDMSRKYLNRLSDLLFLYARKNA